MEKFFIGNIVCLLSIFWFTASFGETNSIDPNKIIDVAIVGGGIAGLYAGYRLVSTNDQNSPHTKLKVELYEISDRLGGRIWSVKIPNTDHLVAELGAMRFLDTHKNIYGLVQTLKLPTTPFYPSPNIQYLRNHRFVSSDYRDKLNYPNKIPYFIPEEDQGLTPDQLIGKAFYRLFPELANEKDIVKIKEKIKNANVFGRPLYAWNVRALLLQVLNPESVQLLYDTTNSKRDLDEMNAYSFFAERIITQQTIPLSLIDGMETLPLSLAHEYENNGGIISLNTKLYTFSIEKSGQESLVKLELGPPELHHPNKIVYAKKLILAIPKKSLTLLHPKPKLFLDPTFMKALDAVVSIPQSKIFLIYATPWWKNLKFTKVINGKSDTTLPLEQSYYLGEEKTKKGSLKAIFLASYSYTDANYLYWKNYFDNVVFNKDSDSTAFYITQFPATILADLAKQLALVNDETIPMPEYSVYMNWGQNPYGGATNIWRPNARPWEIIPYMRHPFKEFPIYIVGQAYSGQQNMEGSINSAERMLQENFGMARASWIPEDYNLGY